MTTFLVCLFAGLGAGLGTGFAGMSAAAVISPMLIAFLGIEPYQAIGSLSVANEVWSRETSFHLSMNFRYRPANSLRCGKACR